MTSRSLTLAGPLFALVLGAAAPASADDDLAAALILGGAGAAIGHSVNGGDGAVVGGFQVAILGAAIADDDHRGDRYDSGWRRARPPVYVVAPPRWRDDWRHRDDWRWRDHDRRHDSGWRDDRGWRDHDGRHDGDDRRGRSR